MKKLDKYLSTPDELFNANAQSFYFNLSGNKNPNTQKPIEVYLESLHEVYFFIQDNLNKPFACIEKIKEIVKQNKLNDTEHLLLVDKILGTLSHHHEKEKQSKVLIQIVDYRNELSPYTDDPEIANLKFVFDIEKIKEELVKQQSPTEKAKYLVNLLFDYSAKIYEIDESEHEYYESIGFVHWIRTEIERNILEQQLDVTNEKPETVQQFKLSEKDGAKIDLIRILNAIYELKLFVLANGEYPTKKIFMQQAGDFFGTNLSNYQSSLSQSITTQPVELNIKVFEEMIKITQNAIIASQEKRTKNK